MTKVTAAGSCITPSTTSATAAASTTSGSSVKTHGSTGDTARVTTVSRIPARYGPAVEVVDDVARLVGPTGAEGVPHQRLAGHLEHVDRDGEQQEHLRGDLVAGQLRGADSRRRGGRPCASEASRNAVRCTRCAPTLTTCHITDGTTVRWWRPSARRLGITMARNTMALSTWAVTVPHALPAIPQSSPNTSRSSRTQVGGGGEQQHDEGPLGVGQAVQVADAGDRDHLERDADDAHPQVGHALVDHLGVVAQQADQPVGGHADDRGHHEPDAHRQPQGLERVGGGTGDVAATAPHRHAHRRAVRQEVEHPHERVEHHRCQRQPTERRGAEPADHRRVGEHVDRLHQQRSERRHRDGEDAPVERVDPPQRAHTLVSMSDTLIWDATGVEIHQVVVGPVDNNVLILRCTETGDAVLLDAANEHERLLELCERLGVRRVLETHGHWDHIQAVPQLRDAGYSVGVTAQDAAMLPSYDEVIEDESVIDVGRLRLHTIHTPGHTPGSMCFQLEGHPILFSGDTLFPGGPGNTTFEGGDFDTIIESVDRKLFTLPPDTIVLPGPRRPHHDRQRAPAPPGVGRPGLVSHR